ncbi:hypothetical protein Tco_0786599 [Tanacetum coccineum]
MNTTQAQQKALDDALVAPADRLEFGKCNMRRKTDIKPKEATFQVVLDSFALTPFYQTFLITTEVPAIYMQEFWATVSIHKSSIRFTINKKKVSLDEDIFREILQFCLKIPGQMFEDLPLKHDILSFIRYLGHSGDIIYISDDQSILRRNKMLWHTARDDTMFTAMRCISRHEDPQVYGTILSKELTNQAMLESKAYKTYYAFASGEKTPKPKLKTKAKVAKSDKKKQPAKMPKAKGLDVLSKVALTEAGYQKKQDTISHLSRKWLSGKEDEDDENDSEDKSDGNDDDANDDDGANDDDNQEGDDMNDDDEETDKEEEEKINDEETIDEEDDDEVTKELYDDVNVNLGNEDADMTNADQGVSEQQNVSQDYSVSSDFTSKLLNLENPSPADNEIASLMETSARHATEIPKITSGLTKTIPPPPLFFNPLPQQATPTPTTTTSEATTSFTSLFDFSFVFKFNDRVTNMENDLSEIKQVDQYAQSLSSIPAIVDRYIDNKLGEAINKAIQAHNLDYRQKAQDEKNAYIELVDTSLRAIIKEEKNVIELLEVVVLARSSSQPKSTYEVAASLSEFELTKILLDKMKESKSHLRADYKKKLYDALVESYNTDKDLFNSYGESAHAEEPSHTVDDSGMQQDQEFITGDNDEQTADKEITKDYWFKKPERPPTPDTD